MDLTPQYSAANILKAYDEQMQHDRDVDKYRHWIYAAKSLADPSYARSAKGAQIRAKFGTSSKGTTTWMARMKMLRDEEQAWIKGQFDERQFKEMRTWESIDDFYKFAGEQGPYYDKERGLGMALKHINARDKEAQRALEKATKEEGEDIKRWVSGYAGSFRKRPAEIRGAVADNDSIPDHLKEAVVKGAVDAIKNIEQTTAGMATAERQAKGDVEADMLGAFTTLITDRYSGRWRGQSTEIQQGLLADIQAEIRSIKLDDFPLELRPALFKAVKDNLTQYGAMGAAYKEKKAEERTEVIQKREDTKYSAEASARAVKMTRDANAEIMARAVWRLVNEENMSPQAAQRQVVQENDIAKFNPELFQNIVNAALKTVTPTAAYKATMEEEKLLTPTGDDQKDINNFERALDMEMERGPALTPLWHQYAIKEKEGIAIDNVLRTLNRVDPGRIDREFIRKEFDEYIKQEHIAAMMETPEWNALVTEMIKSAAKRLRVPFNVIEYIILPKRYELGSKK